MELWVYTLREFPDVMCCIYIMYIIFHQIYLYEAILFPILYISYIAAVVSISYFRVSCIPQYYNSTNYIWHYHRIGWKHDALE